MCQLVNMYSCTFDESKERHCTHVANNIMIRWWRVGINKNYENHRDRIKFINLAFNTEPTKGTLSVYHLLVYE